MAAAAKNDTTLVSRASGPAGVKGGAASGEPSLSADGRFVAFTSYASNLHPDDRENPNNSEHSADVFVRDLHEGTTLLVSRGSGPDGANGNSQSAEPTISADGRFVAFSSRASNLHPDDSDFVDDVFVRDLQEHTTTLVSRASGRAGAKAAVPYFGSGAPSISADGRYVAFASYAANLHPDDSDGLEDVFVRDLLENTTTLVSRASGPGGAKGAAGSGTPSLSDDGRFVAFSSDASNLDPDDPPTLYDEADVFLRDLHEHTTTLVSRSSGPAGVSGNDDSRDPSISADGRFVAFETQASNLHPDEPGGQQVLVRDLETATTTLASRGSGAAGAMADYADLPSISANGRFVAFWSDSADLHPYDPYEDQDVFVRDLKTGTTTLISRSPGPAGTKANRDSSAGSISPDARLVAFVSKASNLHPDDRDATPDIFARELSAAARAGPPRVFCEGRRATIVLMPRRGPVSGTEKVDVIVGSTAADRIEGGGGSDRICGRAGSDRLSGGYYGKDRLSGGVGNDKLRGGRHSDQLAGGPGNDLLDGRGGRDRIRGGTGNDFIPTAGVFLDRVDCGPGRDLVFADPLDHVRHCERTRLRESRRPR
jgi:Tol biopolymer transport system component